MRAFHSGRRLIGSDSSRLGPRLDWLKGRRVVRERPELHLEAITFGQRVTQKRAELIVSVGRHLKRRERSSHGRERENIRHEHEDEAGADSRRNQAGLGAQQRAGA